MSKALIRSTNRRGSRSDKSPPVARKQTFIDPSICERCGAVYTGKTWRRGRRLSADAMDKARWVKCPGCKQARSGEYHGQVLITLAEGTRPDAIAARIANVERRAQVTQPERQIVATNRNGDTLEVLTTSQKLAHRIAREVEKAFGGRCHFAWSDDDGSLLATVKLAARHAKRGTRK